MEMGEGISALNKTISELQCGHNANKEGWKCVLEGKTDSHLTTNITRDRNIDRPSWPPATGKKTIDNCDRSTFPHQSHHLIPWKTLRKHPMVIFIAENPPEGTGTKTIWKDNNYSINHGNNGKFMPYASDLEEWALAGGESAKQELAEKLMDKLGIQLHQSKHGTIRAEGVEQQYKDQVKEYLGLIHDHALTHPSTCEECISKKKDDLWPPREGLANLLDMASRLLENDIDTNRIFVSKYAAKWALKQQSKLLR
jgi:hypothetical protein